MTQGTPPSNKLETEPVGKLLWQYAVPAIVGTMVMSLYTIIDRIFIGQGVGPDAISGLALTFPIMNLTAAVGMLVGAGASARISIVLGQKDPVRAEKILGNSLVLTLALAACYILFFIFFMDDILRQFGGSDKTIPYAREFLFYLLPGMALTNLCYSFNNMMRASGYPQKAMITMLIGAVMNVILDPIFIFWFKMGIKGAAIATVISMAVSTAFVMYHFIGKESSIRFHKHSFRLQGQIIRNIVSIGMSPFLINLTASAVAIFMNTSLQKYGGDTAIGAFGIINSYGMLIVMLIIGLCQGMQPIVGFNFGAGNLQRMQKALTLTATVATIITSLGFIGSTFFPHYLARAFTTDTHLIDVSSVGLRITMMMFPIVGAQIVITNFFQSIGKASISIFLSLSRQVLFLIPAILLLPRIWGLDGVWSASPTADGIATLITVWVLFMQRKLFKPNTKIGNQ